MGAKIPKIYIKTKAGKYNLNSKRGNNEIYRLLVSLLIKNCDIYINTNYVRINSLYLLYDFLIEKYNIDLKSKNIKVVLQNDDYYIYDNTNNKLLLTLRSDSSGAIKDRCETNITLRYNYDRILFYLHMYSLTTNFPNKKSFCQVIQGSITGCDNPKEKRQIYLKLLDEYNLLWRKYKKHINDYRFLEEDIKKLISYHEAQYLKPNYFVNN